MPAFKPDAYSSVSPYLIVKDAALAIAFLEPTFGAKRLRAFADDAGKLMHAEVRIDDTVVMLADCRPQKRKGRNAALASPLEASTIAQR